MIKLPPLGQPLHRVEKRAEESITYTFDLTDTLKHTEVIVSVSSPHFARSRRGKVVEVTMPIVQMHTSTAQFNDCTVKVDYDTNLGNHRAFSFVVRTYK